MGVGEGVVDIAMIRWWVGERFVEIYEMKRDMWFAMWV